MNKTYRKLKKLRALAEMANEQERKKAQEKSDSTYDYRTFRELSFDGIKRGSMPQISISRWEVNKDGLARMSGSWTDIPYDELFDSWVYMEDMKDNSHEDFSSITSLVRHVSRVGFDGLKFGTYRRTFNSTDYLDFEVE